MALDKRSTSFVNKEEKARERAILEEIMLNPEMEALHRGTLRKKAVADDKVEFAQFARESKQELMDASMEAKEEVYQDQSQDSSFMTPLQYKRNLGKKSFSFNPHTGRFYSFA